MNLIPDVRFQIVKWARDGVAHKGESTYAEVRPINLSPAFPVTMDCSGFVTRCYYFAGASDPNGLNYDGAGYTGTLLNRGKHILERQMHVGDLIVYGEAPGKHVVLVVEMGSNPLCASMGQQGDPSFVRHSVLLQLGPPTFLRFSTINRRYKFKR